LKTALVERQTDRQKDRQTYGRQKGRLWKADRKDDEKTGRRVMAGR
jgi:hypothetical protein